jgi:hypothetical protein
MSSKPSFLLRCLSLSAAAAVLVAGGCGEVKVVTQDPYGTTDTASGGDTGSDSTGGADTVGVDTAAAECVTDFDCANMKGKTPCNLPACDKAAGKCILKLRQAGEVCVNPLDEAGECETAACTPVGVCQKTPKKSGTSCGLGACGKKCDGVGLCVAATSADYDDKNPCTVDYCDQGKVVKHEPTTGEVSCSDGDECTDNDNCKGGACVGTAKVCNDGIDCTADACDKAKGCTVVPDSKLCVNDQPCVNIACDLSEGCTATSNKIGACDDGNQCTGGDKCKEGKCSGTGSAELCGCKSDTDCAGKNSPCGGKFTCKVGICVVIPETIVTCPASDDLCSTIKCEPNLGTCVATAANEGKACQDNNACTSATVCAKGQCSGGPVVCDDKNPCTLDNCDPEKGCTTAPTTGACDDGVKCTTGDACNAIGSCTGAKTSCDDGVACTYDQCDEGTGKCINQGQDGGCNDNNPCTKDTCGAKGCGYTADDGGKCDDGNACTADSCSAGACKSVNTCQCAVNGDCDDKNPCTVDSCAAGKCVYANAPSTQSCDVANKCVVAGSGTCNAGVCGGGKPVDCTAAANACNNAVCNPTSGTCEKVSKADSTPCDADGNGCTVADVCKGGQCLAGPPPVACQDTACADQACLSTSATTFKCESKPVAKGAPCDDATFCTQSDMCDGAGKCGGSALMCEGSACFPGVCNESLKQCENKPLKPGAPCDDGMFCTSAEVCNETGQCMSTTPTACKGGACLIGVCDESTDSCTTVPDQSCCITAKECDDGMPCTSNQCVGGKCDFKPLATCSNCITYANDFDMNLLKSIKITNSNGPLQGWQLAYKYECQANSPGCSPPFKGTPGAIYYGDLKLGTYNFGQSNGQFAMPLMTSTGGKQPLLIDFDLYMATEPGNTYDVLRVWMDGFSTTGQPLPPVQLWVKDQNFAPNAWTHVTVNATEASVAIGQGAPFAIRFDFNTGDAAVNETFGVLVDQLTVGNGQCLAQ